jgi:threonine dehydrogenase-like Zn-dependent dehydrogenase
LDAIIADAQRVRLDRAAPVPRPAPGEAIVRPLWMGVAPFDSEIARAPHAHPQAHPLILGHEFVGAVESLEPADSSTPHKRWLGKRVVASPVIACTTCDRCRAGLPAHCRNRRVLGVKESPGCFAESLAVPLRNLVEVPPSLDPQHAALAAPLASAVHAANIARVEGKTYVTILGDSADALLVAQVLARRNASVRLLGTRQDRFTLCEKWGIKHRHQSEVGRRADQDIVVDCSPRSSGIPLAIDLVRPRGKVVLMAPLGLSSDPAAALPASITTSIIEHEIQLLGARGGSLADAINLLARAEVDVLPLITARKHLADGPSALLLASEPDQIKVLLEAA